MDKYTDPIIDTDMDMDKDMKRDKVMTCQISL